MLQVCPKQKEQCISCVPTVYFLPEVEATFSELVAVVSELVLHVVVAVGTVAELVIVAVDNTDPVAGVPLSLGNGASPEHPGDEFSSGAENIFQNDLYSIQLMTDSEGSSKFIVPYTCTISRCEAEGKSACRGDN